jgi:hypothetical protein
VAWAEFEEKEYEVAADLELAAGPAGFRAVFSAGQVLESIVGYDVAADPSQDHPIWNLLNVARPPGVVLVPGHWAPGVSPSAKQLPGNPISLIFQYKRPEWMVGPSAGQWKLWRQPYLRFTIRPRQQALLLRLQQKLSSQAVVRYVSPAFWRRGDFEAALLRRQILGKSGFVGPDALAGHRAWTYLQPGSVGRANPSPARRTFEDLSGLRTRLAEPSKATRHEIVKRGTGLLDHLALLGAAAREREPRLRSGLEHWDRLLARDGILSPPQRAAVLDLASVVSLTTRAGLSWYLLAG